MIPKQNKFPLRTDFLNFKKIAQKSVTKHFLIYQGNNSISQLGVIIPQKHLKSASSRNALKRKIYDLVFQFLKDQKPQRIVVLLKSKPTVSTTALVDELLSSLKSKSS